MTPDNVVARAIELCKFEIKVTKEAIALCKNKRDNVESDRIIFWDEAIKQTEATLRSWQTNLAEFEQHRGEHSIQGYNCRVCGLHELPTKSVYSKYPCNFAELKAKRLMGEE